jgi:hypothetical protein
LEGWRAWAGRVARVGALPTDARDEALRKETLVLFTGFTALVSCVWVGSYWALGLYTSAAIPFAYQVVCVANLAVSGRRSGTSSSEPLSSRSGSCCLSSFS